MRIQEKIHISVIIMAIGVILSLYSIVTSQTDLYNMSVLIFLIGITICNISTNQLIKKYRAAYGDIEEDS